VPDKWPRLTLTLTGPNAPEICRACGETADDLWREHDDRDKAENRWLWLCRKCGDALIEPHPRLYSCVPDMSPAPGAMRICAGCEHRTAEGICGCPRAKANGGVGILIGVHESGRGFIDGAKYSGPFIAYGFHPSACTGKNPTPFDQK
jgi:hypothetical protein